MRCDRRCQRQIDVDKQFAQEKHRPGFAVQHQTVFAAPALTAAGGQLGFQHRGRVGEGPVLKRLAPGMRQVFQFRVDVLRQFFQPRSQHLVVVAPTGVHRHHGLLGLLQGLPFARHPPLAGVGWQIIHADRQHTQCARHQFSGTGAAHAVASHVVHLAVKLFGQPLL